MCSSSANATQARQVISAKQDEQSEHLCRRFPSARESAASVHQLLNNGIRRVANSHRQMKILGCLGARGGLALEMGASDRHDLPGLPGPPSECISLGPSSRLPAKACATSIAGQHVVD